MRLSPDVRDSILFVFSHIEPCCSQSDCRIQYFDDSEADASAARDCIRFGAKFLHDVDPEERVCFIFWFSQSESLPLREHNELEPNLMHQDSVIGKEIIKTTITNCIMYCSLTTFWRSSRVLSGPERFVAANVDHVSRSQKYQKIISCMSLMCIHSKETSENIVIFPRCLSTDAEIRIS